MTEKEIKDRFKKIDEKIEKAFELGNEAQKSINNLNDKIESFKQTLDNSSKEEIKEAIEILSKMREEKKQAK